jgi:uncharacterized protein YcfJ
VTAGANRKLKILNIPEIKMNTSKKILTTVLLSISALASAHQFEDRARVLSSVPEYERVNTSNEQCYSDYESVPRRGQSRDFGGSIIGGVTGGLVGAQVGKGHGNTAATAVGAIAGAIIGDRVQNQRRDDYAQREVRRCQVSDHWENRLTGYRVTYEYAGRNYTTFLQEDPGRSIPLRVNVEPLASARY